MKIKTNSFNINFKILIFTLFLCVSFTNPMHVFSDSLDEEVITIDDAIMDNSEVSTVVQGADGLLYVVVDEDNQDELLLPEIKKPSFFTSISDDTSAIEVGIDLERQKIANSTHTDVTDMSQIDFSNVEDLQSALNSEDFPFLEQEEFVEQIDKTKDTPESEELVKQTRSYFAEQIIVQTNNLNDVPTDAKVNRVAVLASVSGTVTQNRINPPSGYSWTVYVTRSNGYDYTENYSVRRTINGKEAFCLQVGVSATTTYTGSTSGYLTNAQKEVLSSIVLAHKGLGGWTNTVAGHQLWLAAQILVWENSLEKPKSITVTPNWASEVAKHKTAITNRAKIIRTKPVYDKTSVTVHEGDNATFNITNTDGSSYIFATADGGGSVSVSGNKITVNTSEATGTKINVKIRKGVNATSATKDPSMVWTNGSYQKLFTGYYSTEQTLTVNVTRKGTVEVLKVDKDTNKALAGATFTFTVNGTNTDVVTGSDGKAKLTTRLKAGTVVSVKEKSAPANYKLDTTPFNITVVADKATSTTRTNEAIKGAVELTKTANVDNLSLQGVVFTLYNSNGTIYQDNLTTNASGKIIVKNMGLGSYYFKEKSTVKGFALDTTNKPFTITTATTETNPAKINMANNYNLSINKTVSDMNDLNKNSNIWSADSADFLEYNLTTSTIEKLGTRNIGSFSITDNIDLTKVDYVSAKVYSGSTDVSSQFTITHSSGVVKANANAGSLSNATFYGKSYRLSIRMSLKSTIRNSTNKATFAISKSGLVSVGNKSVTSNAVSTTLNAYKIVVNHVDGKEKSKLKVNEEMKFNGESYSFLPLDNLFDIDRNNYKSNTKLSGIVQGKELILEIPYYIPTLKILIEKIQIDTSKAGENGYLPTVLTLSKEVEYEKELDKVIYNIKITDQENNKVVFNENQKLSNYKDVIELKLSTDYLTKGEKIRYVVDISIVENPEFNKFIGVKDFQTVGYTSSEKTLTNDDLTNGNITYSGITRTVRNGTSSTVKEYEEKLNFEFTDKIESKTGYGIPLSINPIYTNEINKEVDFILYSYIDDRLIDSFINEEFSKSNGKTEVKLSRTFFDSGVRREMNFEFPHMNVEEKTGNIFTDNQKKSSYSEIKHSLIDGGNKLYLPIWSDLGEYSISIKSNSIGSNLISIDMTKNVIISAYLFGHIGSETIHKDEILITPIDIKNPFPEGLPKGWTKLDVDWLQGN